MMGCTPFTLGNARGFICSRSRRPRCACGQPATLQCDAPSKRRSGTCDRHLCAGCATVAQCASSAQGHAERHPIRALQAPHPAVVRLDPSPISALSMDAFARNSSAE